MDNNYCVYKHTTPNRKIYVGITGQKPEDRWKKGFGYKNNSHFFRAIQKYGWDNIKHEILLDGLTHNQAKSFEQMYIALYQSNNREFGYNKTSGGEENAKPNDEVIEKMRENNYLNRPVEQYSLKGEYIATYRSGAEADRKIKAKIQSASRSANGSCMTACGFIWVYSDEINKEKIINARVQKIKNGAINCKSRPVFQFTKKGLFVAKYKNLTEAGKSLNRESSHIHQCVEGNRLSAHGFIWLYADDPELTDKLKHKINEKKHPSAMSGGQNHRARAIEQYTLDGIYIKTYPSAQEAADELKIDYSTIKACAGKKSRVKSAGNYIWIHADDTNKQESLKQRIIKGCEKPISQYSLDGKHIRDFVSIKEAKSFLNTKANIGAVCQGKRKTACGYIWAYL